MHASHILALGALGLAAGLFTPAPAHAEFPEATLYPGLHGGANGVLREWDFGINARERGLRADTSFYGMGGLRLGYQVNPRLAVELGGSFLPFSSVENEGDTALEYDLDALYHVLEGDWAPYVLGGVGGYHLVSGDLTADFDPTVHLAVGLRGLVLPWMAVRVEVRDVMSDGFNQVSNNLEMRGGLDFFLAGKPDRDKDGFSDEEDRCPDRPGVESAQGCPDADGDGVGDLTDACPDLAGNPDLDGCPDEDNDGIPDKDDACPHRPGPQKTDGCPDTDGDGVIDKNDACPDVPGKIGLKGCPDQDDDGIADGDDACPQRPGPQCTKGCPDRDGDGVADDEDKCPDVTGLKQFQGCVPDAVKKFTGAIKGITFETGKANIRKTSYNTLDKAVAVMAQFPELKLAIEGHTDDRGDDAFNMKLSDDRANAVRDYLVNKGVDPARLKAQGFGETKPTAANKTATGRAENRRIEFTIIGE
ncbi:MAG: OmpA family protein [Deltaproteobacteria bacterium]|nr:OmpA family protein [Deltaproteobacteria bacterium]